MKDPATEGESGLPDEKRAALEGLLREMGSVCIGYSGGVDSTFLTRFAFDVLGPDSVLAVIGKSTSLPSGQRDAALEYVRDAGIPHTVIRTEEESNPLYAANPADRCFHCKSELWSKLVVVARERGLAVVLDGTNADDTDDYRPGSRAAARYGVRSPLQEVGLSKTEIRALSRAMGLPTWDRPASPCLASRIPYGLAITETRLRQVEEAEDFLRAQGFRVFRVRHHGDAARIEVQPADRMAVMEKGLEVARHLIGTGFQRVLLDVEGYRQGALNESLWTDGGDSPDPRGTEGASRTSMDESIRTLERLLSEAGVVSSGIESVGSSGEMVAVTAEPCQLELLARLAPDIKTKTGFRYLALALPGGSTQGILAESAEIEEC